MQQLSFHGAYTCPVTSLFLQANLDANFEDRNAFVIGMAKYSEEAAVQSKLNEMLEKGQRHAVSMMMMMMIMTMKMTVLMRMIMTVLMTMIMTMMMT